MVHRIEKDFYEKLYCGDQDTEHFHSVFVKGALVLKSQGTLTRCMKDLGTEKHGQFELFETINTTVKEQKIHVQ